MMKFLFFYVAMLVCGQAYAVEWLFDAKANPTLQYNDNELLNAEKKGDFSLEIDPTITISRAMENSSSDFNFGYRVRRYDRLHELDTENPFANFGTSYKTERSLVGLNLGYSEQETRSIAEEDTGNFSSNSIVTTKSISPSFNYNLTAQDKILSSVSYMKRTYDSSDRFNTSDFSDNETYDAHVAWQHQYTDRLKGGVAAIYTNYKADSSTLSNRYNAYNLSATSSYELSELWQLSGQLGMRLLDSNLKPNIGPAEDETSTGSTYSFSASRKDELSNLSFDISRMLLPSSTGDVNEQDSYDISYAKKLMEHLTVAVSGSYSDFKNVNEDSSDETKYTRITPSLIWSLERNLALVFGYSYQRVEESDADDAESNTVSMTLNYDWDGIRFSR